MSRIPLAVFGRLGSCHFASQQAALSTPASSSKFNGEIPFDAVQKTFLLSSGPGGQNVQKNATKVQIKVKLDESATWIPRDLREAVSKRLVNRMNANGEVVIESDRTRERQLNLADCMDKLRMTIYDVEEEMNGRLTTQEDAETLRKKAAAAARHRLSEKRRLSAKKEMRAQVQFD